MEALEIVPGSFPYRVLLPTTMENTPLPAAGQSIGTHWRFTISFDNFSSTTIVLPT